MRLDIKGLRAEECGQTEYLPKDFFPQIKCEGVKQEIRLVLEADHLSGVSSALKNNSLTFTPGAVFLEGEYGDSPPKNFGLEDQKIHQGTLLLSAIASMKNVALKKIANFPLSSAEEFYLQL